MFRACIPEARFTLELKVLYEGGNGKPVCAVSLPGSWSGATWWGIVVAERGAHGPRKRAPKRTQPSQNPALCHRVEFGCRLHRIIERERGAHGPRKGAPKRTQPSQNPTLCHRVEFGCRLHRIIAAKGGPMGPANEPRNAPSRRKNPTLCHRVEFSCRLHRTIARAGALFRHCGAILGGRSLPSNKQQENLARKP